jgi:predicted extracellular nuclease
MKQGAHVRKVTAASTLAVCLAAALAGADTTPQAPPFSQNWTNIGLITVDDNWSAVPGIQGFRGDALTGAVGADPQTLLAADDPGVIDVNANQTNPNTFVTGGPTEFEITNPVVALAGSGTADAPYIKFYLNTAGQSGITLAYNLRDIDASTDNAAQAFALHFRVGAAGAFTNVPAAFVADATTGPSLATLVTPVCAVLPAAANNQALVEVRIMTSNAAGNDEAVGIDDIVISTAGCGAPGVNLSVSDFAQAEGNAGTTTFGFTVNLSAPAGPGGVTFDVATADGTATTANGDYVAQSLTGQTIPAGSSTYAFNVTVNGDTTIEANETFFVDVTNVTGATVIDGQGQGTIQNDDVTVVPIHDVQGNGSASPIPGAVVTVSGIVTGVRPNGFFVQLSEAEYDADPNTSEGIFVFTSAAPPAGAVVGHRVQVTATVAEFVPTQDPLSPPLTELTSPTSVVVLSMGNPLPTAMVITAADNPPTGPIDQLERFEGMRVTVPSLTVVAPTLGNISEPNATATSSGVFVGVVTGQARPFREAGIRANDPPPPGSGVTIPPVPRFDGNPERIRVDSDGLVGGPLIDVATGAVVTGLVGPLDYAFRTYTILPDPAPAPAPVVTGGMGLVAVSDPTNMEFTVASFNLQRFFDDVNDPGIGEPVLTATAFQNRLNKASLAIRNFTKTPDILGVVEVENLATLQALAAKISADAIAASQPDPLYQAFLVEGNDVGGIDVGFLAKQQLVNGPTPRVTVGAVVQENAGELFTNPDASTELLNDRPTLRLMATVNHPNGASFDITVMVNHLRSLNGVDDNAPGSNGWPTAGARVRAKRRAQAESLANLVQARQTADPAERIVLVGDFNAFEFNDGLGDSMGTIAGTPTPANQVVLASPDLVNPDLANLVPTAPAERYSFSFDGNAQTLDHVMVNQALLAALDAARSEHARTGADFPETARNDPNTALRNADHDPIVAFFRVPTFPVELTGFSVE